MSFTSDNITYTLTNLATRECDFKVITAIADTGVCARMYAGVGVWPEWITTQMRRNLTGDIPDGESTFVETNDERVRVTVRVITATVDKEHSIVLHAVAGAAAMPAFTEKVAPTQTLSNKTLSSETNTVVVLGTAETIAPITPLPAAAPTETPEVPALTRVHGLECINGVTYVNGVVDASQPYGSRGDIRIILRKYNPKKFTLRENRSTIVTQYVAEFIKNEIALWTELTDLDLTLNMKISATSLVSNKNLTYVRVGQLVDTAALWNTNITKIDFVYGVIVLGNYSACRVAPW